MILLKVSSPGGLVVKNLPASEGDARDAGPIPGSGRSPGEGNGNPLQYSCLGNPMHRGAYLQWLQSMGSQRVRPDLMTKPPPPKLLQGVQIIPVIPSYFNSEH